MRTTLATYALAGAVGLTGVAGAALVAPVASYAATGDSSALDHRVSSIKDALKGLVTDGTLTQNQADKVASTLADARPGPGARHRSGHRGAHLAAAAEALGMTLDELRAAAQEGRSLAELAEENGVSEDALVSALVTAVKERLDAAVSADKLTQAEADERLAEAETGIREHLDDPLRHRVHRFPRKHGAPPPADEPASTDGDA